MLFPFQAVSPLGAPSGPDLALRWPPLARDVQLPLAKGMQTQVKVQDWSGASEDFIHVKQSQPDPRAFY